MTEAAREKRPGGALFGRDLYVPRMSVEGASVFAAAYRSLFGESPSETLRS